MSQLVDELSIPEASSEEGGSPAAAPAGQVVKRLVHNPVAMLALAYILLMIVVAIFAPLISPRDPSAQDAKQFLGPSGSYLLGTDYLGRDNLSRLIWGTRVSVRAGFQTTALATLIAVPLGLIAGYVGGVLDNIMQRVMDVIQSFPALVLALAIAAVLGPSLDHALIAITIVLVPGLVRIVRAQALAVRQETFVEASRSIGTPMPTILVKRILPGVATALIVAVSLGVGGALLAEAALSFLGLGVQPPNASWGSMLQNSYAYIYAHPQLIFIPGIALALAILSFNLLGDSINDALGQGLGSRKRPKRQKRTKRAEAHQRHRFGLTDIRIPASANGHDADPRGSEKTEPGAALESILSVRDLQVEFDTPSGPLTVVDGVSFSVATGEVLGLVGESGSGKTVTSMSIMRLIPSPPGRITRGSVHFAGRDLFDLSFEEMRELRGNQLSMVFQDPMSSLDPAFTIGHQLVEGIRLHQSLRREQAKARALELLNLVGIPDAKGRMDDYPHRLSGGMRQRVMIAMALLNQPKFLIADEPTTALDVTIQAEVLDLLKRLQKDLGMSMIFVTHDLGVVADICDRVVVMYAGQVVEQASVNDIFAQPRHPYTKALLGAIPRADEKRERLVTIPGIVPVPGAWPRGCRFAPRCHYAIAACEERPIALEAVNGDGRLTRCIRNSELETSTPTEVKIRR